jgi:hypothetical protein
MATFSVKQPVGVLAWNALTAVPLLLATITAAAEVRVHVASGRTFVGNVDPRTDDQRLWLRVDRDGIELLRPIDWDRVTGAEGDGERWTAAELRQRIDALKTAAPTRSPRPPEASDVSGAVPREPASGFFGLPPAGARRDDAVVRSVTFDAQLANWNSTAEVDGLLIHLCPLDVAGHLVPVDGVVTAELIAPRRREFHEVPAGRGVSIDRIATWSRAVRHGDLTTGGVILRLPFQAAHPEFDRDLMNYGLIHLRLAVAGHGIFEETLDGVRIRPFAPLRDLLERSTGHRHWPSERTERGPGSTRRG